MVIVTTRNRSKKERRACNNIHLLRRCMMMMMMMVPRMILCLSLVLMVESLPPRRVKGETLFWGMIRRKKPKNTSIPPPPPPPPPLPTTLTTSNNEQTRSHQTAITQSIIPHRPPPPKQQQQQQQYQQQYQQQSEPPYKHQQQQQQQQQQPRWRQQLPNNNNNNNNNNNTATNQRIKRMHHSPNYYHYQNSILHNDDNTHPLQPPPPQLSRVSSSNTATTRKSFSVENLLQRYFTIRRDIAINGFTIHLIRYFDRVYNDAVSDYFDATQSVDIYYERRATEISIPTPPKLKPPPPPAVSVSPSSSRQRLSTTTMTTPPTDEQYHPRDHRQLRQHSKRTHPPQRLDRKHQIHTGREQEQEQENSITLTSKLPRSLGRRRSISRNVAQQEEDHDEKEEKLVAIANYVDDATLDIEIITTNDNHDNRQEEDNSYRQIPQTRIITTLGPCFNKIPRTTAAMSTALIVRNNSPLSLVEVPQNDNVRSIGPKWIRTKTTKTRKVPRRTMLSDIDLSGKVDLDDEEFELLLNDLSTPATYEEEYDIYDYERIDPFDLQLLTQVFGGKQQQQQQPKQRQPKQHVFFDKEEDFDDEEEDDEDILMEYDDESYDTEEVETTILLQENSVPRSWSYREETYSFDRDNNSFRGGISSSHDPLRFPTKNDNESDGEKMNEDDWRLLEASNIH